MLQRLVGVERDPSEPADLEICHSIWVLIHLLVLIQHQFSPDVPVEFLNS